MLLAELHVGGRKVGSRATFIDPPAGDRRAEARRSTDRDSRAAYQRATESLKTDAENSLTQEMVHLAFTSMFCAEDDYHTFILFPCHFFLPCEAGNPGE